MRTTASERRGNNSNPPQPLNQCHNLALTVLDVPYSLDSKSRVTRAIANTPLSADTSIKQCVLAEIHALYVHPKP